MRAFDVSGHGRCAHGRCALSRSAHRASRHGTDARRSLAAFVLASFALLAQPALAQEVGTATAVNPTTDSTPPGGSTVTLNVGARIVHKERIHTTPSGSAQLRFNDKSSLSVAPNTNIVIDEYVYNPSANSGHMLAKLTGGAVRYVGGELSHQGEVTISTPQAVIGIRGGTVSITQGANGTQVIDHFGSITVQNGAGFVTISRPGYVVTITGWTVPPSQPVQVTQAEIAYLLQILTSKGNQNGGVPGLHVVNVGVCGTGVFQNDNCVTLPWQPTNAGENTATDVLIQGTTIATQPPPPPPQQPGGGTGSAARLSGAIRGR